MREMLLFFRRNMFEFRKSTMYIIFHCHVDKTFAVVPFKVWDTVEASSPFDGALLLVFYGIKKMEGVVF